MKRCKFCGGLNEDDSRRCQYCDTRFPLIGAETYAPGFDSNPSEQDYDASVEEKDEDDDESEKTPRTFGDWILNMLPFILTAVFSSFHMAESAFRQILTAILILIVIISFVAFVSQNKK